MKTCKMCGKEMTALTDSIFKCENCESVEYDNGTNKYFLGNQSMGKDECYNCGSEYPVYASGSNVVLVCPKCNLLYSRNIYTGLATIYSKQKK